LGGRGQPKNCLLRGRLLSPHSAPPLFVIRKDNIAWPHQNIWERISWEEAQASPLCPSASYVMNEYRMLTGY
jgi:hypothetical protein